MSRRRAVWQARVPDRYPHEIRCVRSVDEVQEAIRAAHRCGLNVSVISSGHNYHGAGLRGGSILLDMSGMRRLTVDSQRRQALAEVGVTNDQLDAALARQDLAFPIGHSPSVALGGYLLGGGLGLNSEAWGQVACAKIISVDVVLADGSHVQASSSREPDLFWAARGAGPLFPGIATSFTLEMHPRSNSVIRMSRSYRPDAHATIAEWLHQVLPLKPDAIELSVLASCLDDGDDPVPAFTVEAVAFGTPDAPAAKILAAFDEPPDQGATAPTRWEDTSIPALLAENDDPPRRYDVQTSWTTDTPATLEQIAAAIVKAPSPHSLIHMAVRRNPGPQVLGAWSVADRNLCFIAAAWDDPREDLPNKTWVQTTDANLDDLRTGRYINETDFITDTGAVPASFSADVLDRLKTIRHHYDPDGLLHIYSDLS